jgi:hypothetical protein
VLNEPSGGNACADTGDDPMRHGRTRSPQRSPFRRRCCPPGSRLGYPVGGSVVTAAAWATRSEARSSPRGGSLRCHGGVRRRRRGGGGCGCRRAWRERALRGRGRGGGGYGVLLGLLRFLLAGLVGLARDGIVDWSGRARVGRGGRPVLRRFVVIRRCCRWRRRAAVGGRTACGQTRAACDQSHSRGDAERQRNHSW